MIISTLKNRWNKTFTEVSVQYSTIGGSEVKKQQDLCSDLQQKTSNEELLASIEHKHHSQRVNLDILRKKAQRLEVKSLVKARILRVGGGAGGRGLYKAHIGWKCFLCIKAGGVFLLRVVGLGHCKGSFLHLHFLLEALWASASSSGLKHSIGHWMFSLRRAFSR